MQKALKTPNSEKFVFSCQTSKVAPEPPNSLVFRRKPLHAVLRIPFSAPKSLRLPACRARHRLSPLCHRLLFGRKSAQKRPQFRELVLRRVFRALRPAPFLVQKAQNGRVRRVRFPCQTASGMPKPPNLLVFGRKQVADGHFAQDSIPARRACHRLSPLCHRFVTAFRAEKRAKGLEKQGRLRGFGLSAGFGLTTKILSTQVGKLELETGTNQFLRDARVEFSYQIRPRSIPKSEFQPC